MKQETIESLRQLLKDKEGSNSIQYGVELAIRAIAETVDNGNVLLNKCNLYVTPKYLLMIQTDDDFSVRFKGALFATHKIYLRLDDPSELDDIEILGVWGGKLTDSTKCREFESGIEAIKANPNEGYDSTGGNRGVCWSVL